MCDVTRERFADMDYRCSYEEYVACYCPDCDAKDCKHRNAYRRIPVIDGGLGLCPRLKEVRT